MHCSSSSNGCSCHCYTYHTASSQCSSAVHADFSSARKFDLGVSRKPPKLATLLPARAVLTLLMLLCCSLLCCAQV
jgi:hypothetical protein